MGLLGFCTSICISSDKAQPATLLEEPRCFSAAADKRAPSARAAPVQVARWVRAASTYSAPPGSVTSSARGAAAGGSEADTPVVLDLDVRVCPSDEGAHVPSPSTASTAASSSTGSQRCTPIVVRNAAGGLVAALILDLDKAVLGDLREGIEMQSGIPRDVQRLTFGTACCKDFAERAKLSAIFGLPASPPTRSRVPPMCVDEDEAAQPTCVDTPAVAQSTCQAAEDAAEEEVGAGSACGSPQARARPSARPLELEFDTGPRDTRVWSEDAFGTIVHKPTGTRVSPEKGIRVAGIDYRLSREDIELPADSVLGSGSGGVVQVGWHKPSGVRVAIKTLRVGSDDARREQMLNEIKGLAEAEGCPYLIQWYAGFADCASGTVNVVIELMDLGSLADLRRRLDGRDAPAVHVACVAAQIIRGLAFLQQRRRLHRDVKPQNILHNRAGGVKLTDFGISKDLGVLADVGTTFVGTATYMAPERASGSDYSYESDVWSAGMVLFELASGRYPFCAASFPELFEGLCEGPEPRLQAGAFPAPLCDLVARCLTRDVAKRPDAEGLCEHELVAGMGDADVEAFAKWLATMEA